MRGLGLNGNRVSKFGGNEERRPRKNVANRRMTRPSLKLDRTEKWQDKMNKRTNMVSGLGHCTSILIRRHSCIAGAFECSSVIVHRGPSGDAVSWVDDSTLSLDDGGTKVEKQCHAGPR
jgi:hypothetical protein